MPASAWDFTTPRPRALREAADVGPRGDNVCELHLAFLPGRGVVGVVLEPDPVEVQCRVCAPLEPGNALPLPGWKLSQIQLPLGKPGPRWFFFAPSIQKASSPLDVVTGSFSLTIVSTHIHLSSGAVRPASCKKSFPQ